MIDTASRAELGVKKTTAPRVEDPRGSSFLSRGLRPNKKTPLAAGLFVACLCVEIILIVVRYHVVSDGLASLTPDPRFIRIRPLACFLPEGAFAPHGCYISNTHASRPGRAADVTCCIWDVAQV